MKRLCMRCYKREAVETIPVYNKNIIFCKKCGNKFWKNFKRFMRYN